MISWWWYSLVVGGLMAAAAWVGERGLARAGRPTRTAWVGGMSGSIILPVVAWILAVRQGAAAVDSPTPMPMAPDLILDSTLGPAVASGSLWDGWAVAVWAVGAAIGIATLGMGILKLRRARRTWKRQEFAGRTVLVSNTLGPAVVGLRHPEIVLPEALLSYPTKDLEMVVEHEQSHIEARDPWLLTLAVGVVALVPWHVPLVWQMFRLRRAIEVDCDKRVMAAGATTRSYADLLIRVASSGRRATVPFAAAALAEHGSDLAGRIRALKRPPARFPGLGLAASALAGLVLITSACEIPVPSVDVSVRWADEDGRRTVVPASTARADEPLSGEARQAIEGYSRLVAAQSAITKEIEERLRALRGSLEADPSNKALARGVAVLQEQLERHVEKYNKTLAWGATQMVSGEPNPKLSVDERGPVMEFTKDREPLVYVDGELFPHERMKELDPDQIERIEVLKGSSALRFNAAAGDGIIQIFLKEKSRR